MKIRHVARSLVFLLSLSLFAQDHVSYLPHFTQTPGKWSTVLNLTNPDSVTAEVTIQAWGSDGADLGTAQLTLNPTRGMSSSVADLFPEMTADRGWLTLSSNNEHVKGVMTFEDITTGGESSLPLITQTGANWVLPILENAETRASGFVVANLSDETTTLTLTLTSPDASYKKTVTEELGPKAKLVTMLAGLFGEDVPEKARLQVDGSNPVAAFALTFKNGTNQIIAVPGETWDAGLIPEMQADVDAWYETVEKAGATLGIQLSDDRPMVAASGWADIENVAMAPDSIADIGSITKTFTAALILLLQEDGLLTLDDTLEQWITTGVPNGGEITIRQMLNHTSGIYNYTNSMAWAQDLNNSILTGVPVEKTPQELVDYALAQEPVFEPGVRWEYSNTNFILLGMIIEKVTGDSFVNQLRTRLLVPHGLKNTYLAGSEEVPGRARRYLFDGNMWDVTDVSHMSWAWAAGAMASTPEDLMKWADALYGGQVLSQASMDAMLTPAKSAGQGATYGLGTALLNINGKPAYGHDGATEGGLAFFMWAPDEDQCIGLTVNHRAADLDINPLIFSGLNAAGLLKRKTGGTIEGLVELK